MKIIILVVFALLAATFVADFLKKRAAQKSSAQPASPRLQTANEQPPTETGRLRVAEIVNALKKSPSEQPDTESENSDEKPEEETKLPDPFDGKSDNK